MSRLLRASQVARLTRASATASPLIRSRASLALTRIPRGRVASGVDACRRTRYYSTDKPTPPPPEGGDKKPEEDKSAEKKVAPGSKAEGGHVEGKEGEPAKEKKAEGEEGNAAENQGGEEGKPRPLPEGWIHLTDKDKALLEKALQSAPTGSTAFLKTLVGDLSIYGAPKDLVELIRATEKQPPSVKDMIKFTRLVHKAAIKIMEIQMEEEQKGERKSEGQAGEGKKGKEGGSKEQEGDSRRRFGPFSVNDIIIAAVVWFVISPFVESFLWGETKEITWQELQRMFLDKGLVERFVVYEGRVEVQLNREATKAMYQGSQSVNPNVQYFFTIGSVDSFERRLEAAQDDLGIPMSERIPVKYGTKSPWLNLLLAFGPTLLLVGLLFYSTKQIGGRAGNQMFGFGKSRAKQFNHETAIKVKFSDVAGMDEAKVEIMEFVSFLKSPEKFRRLGAKIPRGAILAGPPGTGKTLLAKATAGECEVPFFSVSGSEFVEMFVGVGPSRVRDLFAMARKNTPCIIFIDEIDAIGRARMDNKAGGGGNDEREATLNQILTEMDGFNTTEQIVVLAGTNRADILDKALMRPGRFDRHIFIDRPTQKGREAIFKVHLKKIVTQEDKEHLVGRLATLTPGFSGADIAHVTNEAALIGMFHTQP